MNRRALWAEPPKTKTKRTPSSRALLDDAAEAVAGETEISGGRKGAQRIIQERREEKCFKGSTPTEQRCHIVCHVAKRAPRKASISRIVALKEKGNVIIIAYKTSKIGL
jgi:hypothetical protein